MQVLVLGSGGREHALAWKISQSPQCERVYLHPGNPGSHFAKIPTLPDLPAFTAEAIAKKARELGVTLVVIGPEAYLAEGYAEVLRAAGLGVVGPGKKGAQLETSKAFSKEFMRRAGIPTAPFFVTASDRELLLMGTERKSWPVVLKLDGLAAGKGVVIAENPRDVEDFATRIWVDKEFGAGPHQVVIEEFIEGKEVSLIGLCDGKRFVPLATATDFKRVGDGNTGPNTGGMGSISPSPYDTPELGKKIEERILRKILAQLSAEEIDYRGALYVGIMVDAEGNPHVLEFNARFGDPETQALMLRLKSDFVELLHHTALGTLSDCPAPVWTNEVSVYVVAAASGYPGKMKLGDALSGMDAVSPTTQIFYSGVKLDQDRLVTAGGRVLGLGTTASDFAAARTRIYHDLKKIHWDGIHYRHDIGG